MKVYIVEEGEYSGRSIIAVMSTLELAKDAARVHIELSHAKYRELELYTEQELIEWKYRDVFEHRETDAAEGYHETWRYTPNGQYTIHVIDVDQLPTQLPEWK